MKAIMKRIMIISGLLISLAITGCNAVKKEGHEAEEAKFQVTSPLRTDTSVTRSYVCQIHSIRHIELRALERGYLQNIYVDEGQSVHKGQVMFQIMPLIYQAELQKTKAEARLAEIEYLNTKQLADSNVVSQNELAMTMAKYEKAKAEQSLSEAHLNFTEIKAPFDGMMDRLHVRPGSLLDEGELLTNLADNSEMWVYFNVPEAEYLDYIVRVKRDSVMNVRLQMANGKLFDQPGRVETIEADFNNETGNIAFRATFPNPNRILRHGETGNILVKNPIKKAMIIPQKATFEILDKKYVFVIGADNKIETRHITIAEELPHIYVISDGLSTDDKILLEGLRKVRNGQEIEFEFRDPAEVISDLDLYAE